MVGSVFVMPRQSRIDFPGALHHIIVRGIERRKIFRDDQDRNNFIERLGKILEQSKTGCFAWALIPNHFHLLLRLCNNPHFQQGLLILSQHPTIFSHPTLLQGHHNRILISYHQLLTFLTS